MRNIGEKGSWYIFLMRKWPLVIRLSLQKLPQQSALQILAQEISAFPLKITVHMKTECQCCVLSEFCIQKEKKSLAIACVCFIVQLL
jgi:hypothetical protein